MCFFQGSGETEQNELYTFHEAVSQLQDAEEQLVECHKKSVEVYYERFNGFILLKVTLKIVYHPILKCLSNEIFPIQIVLFHKLVK